MGFLTALAPPWLRVALLAALFLSGAAVGAWVVNRVSVQPLKQTIASMEAVAAAFSDMNRKRTQEGKDAQAANQKDIARLRADNAVAWARLRDHKAGAGGMPDVQGNDSDRRPAPDGSEGSCSPAAEPAIAAAVSTLMADDSLELDLIACRRDLRTCASVCR